MGWTPRGFDPRDENFRNVETDRSCYAEDIQRERNRHGIFSRARVPEYDYDEYEEAEYEMTPHGKKYMLVPKGLPWQNQWHQRSSDDYQRRPISPNEDRYLQLYDNHCGRST
ncbi:hypothetical protein DPMN_118295 [Dreissena polymorpha]|uniref:Uncharacterized protein n=1 Tax=Dreissena polymorpha TaxID=45954 RepID=A0A9D4JQY9_DREPO|nr:hypothetical protein DPMN_118295 [Dreissena polymorpha]